MYLKLFLQLPLGKKPLEARGKVLIYYFFIEINFLQLVIAVLNIDLRYFLVINYIVAPFCIVNAKANSI